MPIFGTVTERDFRENAKQRDMPHVNVQILHSEFFQENAFDDNQVIFSETTESTCLSVLNYPGKYNAPRLVQLFRLVRSSMYYGP